MMNITTIAGVLEQRNEQMILFDILFFNLKILFVITQTVKIAMGQIYLLEK